MRVRVKFFASFRDTFGAKERDVFLPEGATAAALLDALADTPEKRTALFRGPSLQPHVIVLVNGVSLSSRGGLAAGLDEDDAVAIFPMLGGG
jgi:MoaD family protein